MISTELNLPNFSSSFFANRDYFNSHDVSARVHDANRPEFSSITAEGSQKILNQQLATALNEQKAVSERSTENRYAHDYSPEKVADRLLQTVSEMMRGSRFAQQDPMENLEAISQIKEGIKNGFSQARDILAELGVLNGEIASNVDKTEALVEKGLTRLFSNENIQPSRDVYHSQVKGYQFEENRSVNLEIETKDGDRVHIEIEKTAGESRFEFSADSKNQRLAGFSENRFYSEDFSFSVEGDLDETELSEISNLIQQSGEFAQKFSQGFSDGSLNEAVKHANRLGFNTPHLAEFSLTVESTRAVKVSAAYQEISVPRDREADLEHVARAADFVHEAQKLLHQNQNAIDGLKQTDNTLSGLILELTDLVAEAEEQFQAIAEQSEQLLSTVFNDLQTLAGIRREPSTQIPEPATVAS